MGLLRVDRLAAGTAVDTGACFAGVVIRIPVSFLPPFLLFLSFPFLRLLCESSVVELSAHLLGSPHSAVTLHLPVTTELRRTQKCAERSLTRPTSKLRFVAQCEPFLYNAARFQHSDRLAADLSDSAANHTPTRRGKSLSSYQKVLN